MGKGSRRVPAGPAPAVTGKSPQKPIPRVRIMFRSLPRMLGFAALVLCVGTVLFSTSATGQAPTPAGFGWINGNHVPKAKPAKAYPPIFDKGFRPGFGIAPVIESPRPRPPVNNLLGGNNQGNQ